MTARTAHRWSAALVAAGALLAATAALRVGPPASVWARAAGLAAYGALGALTLCWGQAVYGAPGALAAVGLMAFAAPALAGVAAAGPLLAALAQLAAAYALMRCLLDPALQWTLLAGVAIAAALPAAGLCGQAVVWAAACMGGFSLLLVAARVLTAERSERRVRVAQAAVMSVGLAWAVAVVLAYAVARLSSLPSPAEYGRADRSLQPLRVLPAATAIAARADAEPVRIPIAPLVLTAVRPWRRQRRYSDAAWLLALFCLAVPLWRAAAGSDNLVAVVPILALLAGACWDAPRPRWLRRAATAALALHVAAAVLLWPRYAAGVREAEGVPRPAATRWERGLT